MAKFITGHVNYDSTAFNFDNGQIIIRRKFPMKNFTFTRLSDGSFVRWLDGTDGDKYEGIISAIMYDKRRQWYYVELEQRLPNDTRVISHDAPDYIMFDGHRYEPIHGHTLRLPIRSMVRIKITHDQAYAYLIKSRESAKKKAYHLMEDHHRAYTFFSLIQRESE